MQQRAYDMLVITHLVVCAGLFGSTNFGPTSRTPVLSLPPLFLSSPPPLSGNEIPMGSNFKSHHRVRGGCLRHRL